RVGGVGLGHYTYHLLRNLKQIDKDNEYVIFFDSTVRQKDIEKFNSGNFSARFFPYQKYGKFLPGKYKDIMLSGFLNREKLDIFHMIGLSNTIPPKISAKLVFTARGLGRLKAPEHYSSGAIKTARIVRKMVIENAGEIHIIVPTEEMKKDAGAILRIPDEKISIIHEGIDRRLCDAATEEIIDRVKRKYNLGNHAILYMGTIEPSKNIPRMLEAYKKFRGKIGWYYKLVIAGKDGWMADEIRNIAVDLEIANDVVFTNYIPPEDLSALFKAATMFMFVPLYEGFGTPVVEAMACGLPIVASDLPVLREVAGNAALFANPYDTEAMANMMLKIAKDKSAGKTCIENGFERIKNFCWEKTARQTLEVYNKVIKL
ncbi:MAG: glycosyltransferase family 1 protein, partial [bacterium]